MAKLPMPFSNPRSYAGHSGVDFPQSRGTAIRASGPGYVLRLPHTTRGGYWTTIRYDNGATIGYAHQDKKVTVVRVGQRVSTGTTIGYVGSLGSRSTGPHLHIENINQPTEAGIWAVFDRNRVIGSGGGSPAPAGGGSGKLTEDGKLGPATVKALQKVLGVSQDGEWGSGTTTALQKKLIAYGHKISADGALGPATTKALQTFLLGASKADGKMGPETIRGLQHYLNTGGTFTKKTTPPPVSTKLTVDGEMGPATVKALQKKLGVTVDGKMGPDTIKALQKKLGVTADSALGPNTVKALQKNVGATVDGALGPNTVKALQTFLNAGKNFSAVVVTEDPIVTYPKPAAPTYSGATWWGHSSNSSPRRSGDKVQYFVVHHAADTNSVEAQRTRFMNPNDRKVSPNWLIGKDGSVSEIVPPDNFRAWTTGKFDYNAVTVETQNSSGAPTWGITEESHVAIAKLVAWASKRYGFPIDRKHVLGHREVPDVPATACPGPSMDLDKIVTLAKQFAAPVPTEPVPVPGTTWKLEIPKDEAVAAGKALDEAIAILTQFRKLLP